MKTENPWKHVSILVTVLLLLISVGPVMGQGPEPPQVDSVTHIPDPPEPDGEGVGVADEAGIVARPAETMNYQGYLTDGSGNPLDGDYDMVFSLWDGETGGNREWGDETHTDVSVSNGIFSVVLGETVLLDTYTDFDEQLYLEITVNGTTLPRQMLRAVPYAMGLTVGAHVIGATDASHQYALWVENSNGHGLRVNAVGDDLYGIRNDDVTYSDDGYAGRDTYVFAPTLNAILPYNASGEHLAPQNGNYMRVDADVAGTASVYVPIQIERPYGRDYLLRRARIYYKVNEASITWAGIMGINLTNGTQPTIGSNGDDHTSTTFSYFDIEATNYYTVSTTMAPASIWLSISMDNNFGYVELYGVRLQLDSSY